MNLDRLKKLVMLANHNPSDHEANRAARLVCKMIEENDFQFPLVPPVSKGPVFRHASTPYGPNDWFKKWYENQAKDIFEREERRRREEWVNGEWNFTREETKKKREHKRYLQCKTCGGMKETIFQGAAELFECNPCQWTAYQKKAEVL